MKKITLALAWLLIMSLLMTCAAFAEDIDDAFDPIDEVEPGTEITETFEPTPQLFTGSEPDPEPETPAEEVKPENTSVIAAEFGMDIEKIAWMLGMSVEEMNAVDITALREAVAAIIAEYEQIEAELSGGPEAETHAVVASGKCGTNASWSLDSNGTLAVSGTGTITTCSASAYPWYAQADKIKKITIAKGITNIPDYAFRAVRDSHSAYIPSSVTAIGTGAFYITATLYVIKGSYGEEWAKVHFSTDSIKYHCETHTPVKIPAVASTCSRTGLTEGSKCSVCNTIIKAQQTTARKPHTSVVVPAVAATCSRTGLTQGSKCSVCNAVIVAQQTVPKKPHTAVTDPAVPATCTTTGKTAGTHCSVCRAVITAQQTVPATGHKYDSGVITVQPGYGTAGVRTYTCTVCGRTYTETIPKKELVVNPGKSYSVSIFVGETFAFNSSVSVNSVSWKKYANIELPYTSSYTYWKVKGLRVCTEKLTIRFTKGKSATINLKVLDPKNPASVQLMPAGTISLDFGKTLSLRPVLTPATATATYTWKTSNKKVATVSSSGVVTTKGLGKAKITVTATRGKVKKSASVTINVVDPTPLQSVALNMTGTVSLVKGNTLQLNSAPVPAAATGTVKWTTSNKKVATVSKTGLVTAKAKGTATIKCSITRNKKTKTASLKVSVTPQ